MSDYMNLKENDLRDLYAECVARGKGKSEAFLLGVRRANSVGLPGLNPYATTEDQGPADEFRQGREWRWNAVDAQL